MILFATKWGIEFPRPVSHCAAADKIAKRVRVSEGRGKEKVYAFTLSVALMAPYVCEKK